MSRPETPENRCPRCGLSVSYYKERDVAGRTYVYAVHYMGKRGRRSRFRECYLGPRDGYRYVSRLHVKEGLTLKGAFDSNRILEYLDAIIGYVSSTGVDPGVKSEIARKVEKISRVLELCR